MVQHLGRAIRGSRAFFVFRDRSDPVQTQIIACHPPLPSEALLRCLGAEHVVCERFESDGGHETYVGIAAPAGFENAELALEMTTVAAESLAIGRTDLAPIDALTGLPDRDAFATLLNDRLAAGLPTSLLVIDVDRYYRVVARFGDAGGCQLVQQVALRLTETLGDVPVARLGGDKFGVLVESPDGERAALALAAEAHTVFRSPFRVSGEEIFVTASIGVSVPTRTVDAATMVHQGDAAIALATDAGGGVTEIFRESMNNASAFALLRERDVRHAVSRDEFTVYFQPIVSTGPEDLHAFEALLRWRNPEEGLLPPATFLDVLHDTGLIEVVGRRVIHEACEHAARWMALSGRLVPVSVNIAPVQLYDEDFCDEVARALAAAGLPPQGLILELTEDAFIADVARARAALGRLRQLGVRLLIDDFGSGYSSLTYLHELPVSGIKLDRQWFRAIETSGTQREIVRTIVGLAHFMAMEVVAEGIESIAQLNAARALHCDFAQGFCFSQALDAEQATRYLAKTLSRSAAA